MTMPYNITTITDWGINNQYLSIFYGELLKNNINTTVIVTSNDIHPNDFATAHYLFSSTWHHFPDNTIHLISINSNIPPENGFLYIQGFNHHFICPNNGSLYPFINNNFLDLSIYKIKNETISYSSFYELEYYIFAITNICNSIDINSWTTPITDEKLIIPYFFPFFFKSSNLRSFNSFVHGLVGWLSSLRTRLFIQRDCHKSQNALIQT